MVKNRGMRKLINIFLLFGIITLSKAQSNLFKVSCISNDSSFSLPNIPDSALKVPGACTNTSAYYSDNNLYLPQTSDNVIYIKMNFIFLTKPDGKGNFEQNNPEHVQVVDDLIANMNYRLANLGSPAVGCEGYGNNNLTNTKLQVIVNKIWKVDPAWDFLYTGYVPCSLPNAPLSCTNFNKVYPPTSDYYYTYLDNDPNIPLGINVVFANNGSIYNEFVNNSNYSVNPGEGWAASEFPYYNPLDRKLRQFYPNLFNKYLWMKNYISDNPDPNSPYPNTPWSTVRSWYVGMGYWGFTHELGHNLGLGHHDCSANIMSYDNTAPATHDYFSNNDIKTMFRMASVTSVRQYFTDSSFKNTNLGVANNQIWDLNFRLYSNVEINNNSSLKTTCKIIMAPQSRFIVKNGSNFIIEGAEITSANKSTWNGIKVEGKGYLLINPNTLIDTKYFYAYADNTPLTNGRLASDNNVNNISKNTIENKVEDKGYKIYPNPTGDFINIETKNNISRVEIYNLLNKSFSPKFKSNRVDVRSLPQGNYILKIYSNSEVKTVHFIKN